MQSTQTQQHSSIRALRHPLWLLSGFWICVVIAMAVVFGVVGLFINPMLPLVGLFVFFAGQQELAAVRYRYARRAHDPLEVLPAYEDELDWPTPAPRRGFSGFTWDTGSERWIEWRNGRPVHTISVN